jgi:intracellular septation protein A
MSVAEPAASPPARPFRFVQMIPMLFFDVVLPIAVYNLLTSYGVSTLWALAAGGVSPALNNLRSWVTSRRLEPLGIIVIALMAAGTAGSLISGSVLFALIKESFLTGVFGAICLGSLFAKRPLLFYIVRQFVAGDDKERLAWWNGLWQYPDFRRAMRFVTLIWGIAYVAEALVRVALALTLKPGAVVVISPIMGFGMLIVLIFWTQRHMLALRDRRMRENAAAAAATPAISS